MRFATTWVSISSRPRWTWNESGGLLPRSRVFSAALALPPAPVPPEIAALTISTLAFAAV